MLRGDITRVDGESDGSVALEVNSANVLKTTGKLGGKLLEDSHGISLNSLLTLLASGNADGEGSTSTQEQIGGFNRFLKLLLDVFWLAALGNGDWDGLLLLFEKLLSQHFWEEGKDAAVGQEQVERVAELAFGLEGLEFSAQLGDATDFCDGGETEGIDEVFVETLRILGHEADAGGGRIGGAPPRMGQN